MSPLKKIVIVGAGVAGSILVRRLAALPGVAVTCLERVAPDDHSEAGTGLNVGPNAIKALRACDPTLADEVIRQSLPWTQWRTSLADGTVLFDLPLARVADNAGIRIRWSELYRILRSGASPAIRYGCEVTSIGASPTDPHRTRVAWTENGQAHTIDGIDLLIGTDGRYSATRAAFSGLPEARHVGVAILRVLVQDRSQGLVDDYEQWFNRHHRLLAFRVPPDHIYIAGTYPIEPGAAIPDDWKTPEGMRRAFLPEGREASPAVRWLVNAMCEQTEHAHWARMQESDVRFVEPVRQVLYLGDSAHGMAPTLGQGATQAMEDASCAALLIEAAMRAGRHGVRDWLDAIDLARRERIRFAMELSVRATDTMLQGADPVAGARWKTEDPFIDDLTRLFRDVALGEKT
ncbi:FAD-dependent monooxygenase [Hydrogenophaga laconesensis]|uniref:Salicylate hydroxylase n=1 Tax=Hydrogenophaga laconesensis TaxID=1805971 RepID=A0ABU1VDQ1_9BURK|nr:FAD-dependent monooxygenase [Hydrogenophaga laconesensis]MDR7095612.1 salicylate hydroxylase [Hydrogenophaga laconesensis]